MSRTAFIVSSSASMSWPSIGPKYLKPSSSNNTPGVRKDFMLSSHFLTRVLTPWSGAGIPSTTLPIAERRRL